MFHQGRISSCVFPLHSLSSILLYFFSAEFCSFSVLLSTFHFVNLCPCAAQQRQIHAAINPRLPPTWCAQFSVKRDSFLIINSDTQVTGKTICISGRKSARRENDLWKSKKPSRHFPLGVFSCSCVMRTETKREWRALSLGSRTQVCNTDEYAAIHQKKVHRWYGGGAAGVRDWPHFSLAPL